jgi:ABC-type multidrug transport system fused ATPase/permease subunit
VLTLRKVAFLLTRRQRLQAVVLLALMVIGMALEMLGIGLVLPALMLMTRGVGTVGSPAADSIAHLLGNPSREQIVGWGILALVGVYAVKSVFLTFLLWRQMRFVWGVQAELSYRLFAHYLHQPYLFHLHRNSAILMRNATSEVGLFSHILLGPALNFLAEGLVLAGIAAVLLLVEPLGTIIIAVTLATVAYGFHLSTHRLVSDWGSARHAHEGRRIQCLQQGLGGVKDVLLLAREQYFLDQYQTHNLAVARASRNHDTLHQTPRLALEVLAVLGLAIFILFKIRSGVAVDSLVPTIGLFAAAAFRIMPSANRVMAAAHHVQYAFPALSALYDELSPADVAVAPHAEVTPLTLQHSIRLTDVTFAYPGAAAPALSQIELTIACGRTVGFIGGSGAGKTTLVNVLLGLLPPDSGRVEVDGADIAPQLRSWQRTIGYVPQAIFLTDDSLRRNIAFGIPVDRIDEAAVCSAVRAAQLEEFVASLPAGLDTPVGERGVRVSGGQLQRIGIARALYHNPTVLVLDEATSSLDTLTERGVMSAIGALHGEKTIIIVAHRLSTLQDCDQIFRLESGRLVAQGDAGSMIGPTLRSSTVERVLEAGR